jgi:multidrug efflux pump subunit AcrA (membrane-fusion protein)
MTPKTSSPNCWSPLFVTAAASLVLLAAGCKPPAQHGGGFPPPPQVTVATVEQRELTEWEELTGRTAPVEFVEVRPRVTGHIEKVLFESGQLVKKGTRPSSIAVKPSWRWPRSGPTTPSVKQNAPRNCW